MYRKVGDIIQRAHCDCGDCELLEETASFSTTCKAERFFRLTFLDFVHVYFHDDGRIYFTVYSKILRGNLMGKHMQGSKIKRRK
jgi:hypothetical protein